MENTTKSREKKQKDKYDHSIADIFIENATVITLDEQRRVIRDGGVVIEGNRIKDIGKSSELQKRYKAARIINGKDRVILPGFIDSHVHANQSFVKSLIHGEPYLYWSRIFRPFEYVMTEEDSYIATLLHILTSIRMGITCFVETGSYYPDVMGQAVVETGMRCVLSRLTMDTKGDLPHTQQGILPDETTEEGLQRSSEFVERWHGQGDGRIRAWLSMHMLQICSDDLYCGAKKLADKYGAACRHISVRFAPRRIIRCFAGVATDRASGRSRGPRTKVFNTSWGSLLRLRYQKAGGERSWRCPLPQRGRHVQARNRQDPADD